MTDLYLGIDQSKRSTGMVLVNEEGELIDYKLINEPKLDGEELILLQLQQLHTFILDNIYVGANAGLAGALIEGLSFGSVGSGKDFLAGLQWAFRVFMYDTYRFLGTVPVSEWRSKVLTKEEQREAKAAGKDGLKKACVEKLPWEVREAFVDYVGKLKVKKDALYDACDAYWIAQHCKKVCSTK